MFREVQAALALPYSTYSSATVPKPSSNSSRSPNVVKYELVVSQNNIK